MRVWTVVDVQQLDDATLAQVWRDILRMRDKCGWTCRADMPAKIRRLSDDVLEEKRRRTAQMTLF